MRPLEGQGAQGREARRLTGALVSGGGPPSTPDSEEEERCDEVVGNGTAMGNGLLRWTAGGYARSEAASRAGAAAALASRALECSAEAALARMPDSEEEPVAAAAPASG